MARVMRYFQFEIRFPGFSSRRKVSRDKRKKVEVLFADLKRILHLTRLRLRLRVLRRQGRVSPRRHRTETQTARKATAEGRPVGGHSMI